MSQEARLTADPSLLLERAAGMTVLERHLFTARRAGVDRLWVDAPRPGRLRLPEGLEVLWRQAPADVPEIPGDRLWRVAALRDHLADPRRDQAPGSSIGLRPWDRARIVDWLLDLGPKSQDGYMARHFDRHISLFFSRLLLETSVTPNMMTLVSFAIGLRGAVFFLGHGRHAETGGALLIWLHSVMDGCDGELARIRFQESAFGRFADFWGDNVVHLALFGCMAVGFARADRSALPLFLGAAAAVGTLGSALAVYFGRLRRSQPEMRTSAKWLTRLETMLAQRDFIYLLIVLAVLDRTYEFLWASAIGSLLFFMMTLYGRLHREQSKQPHPAREGEARRPAAGDGGGHQHLYSRG